MEKQETELKAQLCDVYNQMEQLQARFNQLTELKKNLIVRIQKLQKPEEAKPEEAKPKKGK
jgi:hypothetical protein